MKQTRKTVIAAAALMLAGCFLLCQCGRNEDILPEIVIDPAEVVFTSDGGTSTVELHANCKWTAAVPDDAFFTLSPEKGEGDATLTLYVPEWDDVWNGRGFIIVFTADYERHLVQSRLVIQQTVPPGKITISDFNGYDITTYEPLQNKQLTPFHGECWMNVEANNEWWLDCDPPSDFFTIERGSPGKAKAYFYYPANISGETIEYHIKARCETASGIGRDSIVLVQPPSEGTMRLLSISPSEDGQTIPAAGADLYFHVKSNTLWQVKTDANLYYSGLGYNNEDTFVVHVPPYEEPGGRTIRIWLRLSEKLDTNLFELVQR